MKLILKDQSDILKVQNELMNILPELKEKPYICEIKPYKPKRSLDANAYFHVLVDKMSKVLKISESEMKNKLVCEYSTTVKDPTDSNKILYLAATSGFDLRKYDESFKYPVFYKESIVNGQKMNWWYFKTPTHLLNPIEMANVIDMTIQDAKDLGIETLTPMELENLKGYKG